MLGRKRIIPTMVFAIACCASRAIGAVTVEEIKDVQVFFFNIYEMYFVTTSDKIFFAAGGFGADGTELWVSDGTTNGTHMVRDINPDMNSSNPSDLVVYNDKVYFCATDRTTVGQELWVSDGTEAGTYPIGDLIQGANGVSPSWLTVYKNRLYFNGTDSNGSELWTSDGTEAGTYMLKNINPGSASSSPTNLTVSGNTLFFIANDGTNSEELWKTDGTASGTMMVKNINQYVDSVDWYDPFADVNGKLFFVAHDGINGDELFTSDGSSAGTHMVKNIGNPDALIDWIVECKGMCYFDSMDRLYKTDGTQAGTTLLLDNLPSSIGTVSRLTTVGEKVFFLADDIDGYTELWVTDGEPVGTHMVKSIRSGFGDIYTGPETDKPLADFHGRCVFAANNGVNGEEPWVSDGTVAGTYMIADIVAGDSDPRHFTPFGDKVYFVTNDGKLRAINGLPVTPPTSAKDWERFR